MPFDPQPVVLQGRHLRLEPLSVDHAQGLYLRGQEEADWHYMPRPCFVDLADCRHWIEEALADPDSLAFAYVETGKGRVIGSSRYLNIRREHRSLEIGWTWLGRDYQRTAINTEAKLLLIGHAIETLGALRVEFKTDGRNLRSQEALERIGAVREGVLRKHMRVQDGFQRDSVYFSITDDEWPAVKQNLQARLLGGPRS